MPFALSVLGIYLTRSGSTGSIHSFAEDPVVGRVLLAGFVLVMGLVVYLARREPGGEPWGCLRLDRDGWILINTILLGAALVFITAGSAYPAFMSVFGGDTVLVDARFFVVTILPIAVVVAASLTLALRRRWWPALSFGAIAVAAITVAMVGLRPGVWLIAPAVASLVSLAFAMTADRPRGRRLVAHLAHLGMALLLAAVAGSSFGAEFTGTMRPGESVVVGGHRVVLIGLSTGAADRYVYARAQFEVDGNPLVPEIRAYEEQASPVAEPALRSNPIDDVTVAISLLFPDGETVDVSVFVRPLVWWVWVGAGLIGLAALVYLVGIGGDAARPRRSATAGLPRAGTTSGTPAR
jgi:cytochrome c-type biogenesis protein CcmF